MFYRGIVQSVNEEAKTAFIYFIDFGNEEKAVAFSDMRKTLICFEYAAQANKCILYRPNSKNAPASDERKKLIDIPCVIRVESRSVKFLNIEILDDGAL